jgi:AraC family transcriptional regulator, arabinose operon regulatory protein
VGALEQPVTSRLVVTDCGFFPRARSHAMSRPEGLSQAIVIVCRSGRGWCRIERASHGVERGDVVVIPPGVPHSYGAETADPWTVSWFHVAGADVRQLLSVSAATIARPVIRPKEVFRIASLSDEIVELGQHLGERKSMLATSGAAWNLLALLSEEAVAHQPLVDVVARAQDFLSENVAARISVNELAAMSGMSASYFSAQFTRIVGVSPLRYHNNLRMARARELLDLSNQSIGSISESLGYVDRFYFSRQFKSAHGMTPMQYRQLRKG